MQRPLFALLTALLVVGILGGSAAAQATPPFAATVLQTANLRAGPGTTFAVVGSAAPGQVVNVEACNDGCTWYQLDSGEWIAAFLVEPAVALPTVTPANTSTTTGLPLTLVSWNVESGGALQNVVADRIGSFQDVDIWGLSEVNAIDAEAFEFGAEEGEGADYDSLLGTTGAADRLLLIWDAERFEQVDSGEMLTIGETGRAPLWVQLRDQTTELEFIVMVNHLHRSNDGIRHRQAQALNTWAATQDFPVIALGDYNFDWNLPNGEANHDLGYDNLTANGVWEWVRPAELVTTQCSGWPCTYTSVLDFFFVAGPAQEWQTNSEIVVAANDFPDDLTTPDHRPVMAVFTATGAIEDVAPSVTVTPTVTITPTPAPPTATPTPTVPACPQADGTANLRGGPGTNYPVVGGLQAGQCVTITGRNAAGDWFQLSTGAWVAAFLIDNAPPIETVPVVAVRTDTPGYDPSYPTLRIPIGAPDLDCGDIPYGNFPVLPPDPHGFDGDHDGIGCESNTGPSSADSSAPAQPTATPVPPTPVPQQPQCDPNYAGACIPIVSYDLDCGDVSARRFQSIGSDPHGFDGDNDGIACER